MVSDVTFIFRSLFTHARKLLSFRLNILTKLFCLAVIFIGNEFGIVLCSWFTAVSMNYSSLESRLSMLLYNGASSLMYDTAVVSVYVIGCTDVNLHSYRTRPLLLTSLLPCWEVFCLSCPFAAAVWLSCNEIYSALCTQKACCCVC